MNTLRHLLIVLMAMVGFSVAAQQTPAPAQRGAITITGATVHIGNGSTIKNATLIFENGIITAIGASSISVKGTVINAAGEHVYPGFIAPAKSLGLIEVNAVRASNDQDEIGDMIPHIRSIIAYNAESKVLLYSLHYRQ
jgi:imidazolonepropionase-like amidohydrolase